LNKKYYILSILLLWAGLLFADDVKFTASVNKTQVATGEVFEVTFSINGNAEHFAPPNFSGFQVVAGPNVSTSMTSVNGNMTMSNSYSYDLVPTRVGTFTIGTASIVANGHTLNTNSIRITVVKGKPVPQNSRSRQMQYDDDDGQGQASSVDVSKQLFIRAVVDKTHVYQGEQITVNYRVYTRVGIMDNQVDKLPELNGFWSQDITDQKQTAQWKTETVNGLRYNVADVKQVILFPERSGNLTLDPLGMTFIARIPAPSRDFMDQFFGGAFEDKKLKLKSPPVTIHVDPLPEAGKPEGYDGAVGAFSINASVDKTSLKANDAINFNIKVTGKGNIKLLKNLNVVFPADFEKYDPKVTDTITSKVNGIAGSRSYNYLLIPRHQGTYTIEPVKFSYFNPATRRYVTLTTKPFTINVAKGANESNVTALSLADKQDIKLLDKDIRYIKTGSAHLSKEGDEFLGSGWYYLLLLLGPVLAIGALVYRKWDEKNNSDIVKVKSRKASKIAAKHLASAQQQLINKNQKAFYDDLFKGIYGYLSDKLNIPYANLDKETIAAALKAHKVNESLIRQLEETLDLCDMARYAPVTGIAERDVFEKAKTMINDIENEI
jgi:hypothetical protein